AVTINTKADYTVSITAGEGTLESASWTFSDAGFSGTGLTVSHLFSRAGETTLKAGGYTSLGQSAEAIYTVIVCQVQTDRCNSVQPCCAALAWKNDVCLP